VLESTTLCALGGKRENIITVICDVRQRGETKGRLRKEWEGEDQCNVSPVVERQSDPKSGKVEGDTGLTAYLSSTLFHLGQKGRSCELVLFIYVGGGVGCEGLLGGVSLSVPKKKGTCRGECEIAPRKRSNEDSNRGRRKHIKEKSNYLPLEGETGRIEKKKDNIFLILN